MNSIERQITLALVLGALVFTCIGGYFLSIGVSRVQEAVHSNSWPNTQGRVVDSFVNRQEKNFSVSGNQVNREHANSSSAKSISSYAHIKVVYQVQNVSYEVERLSVAGNQFMFDFLAQAAIDKYPVGAFVPVFYHPARAEYAVLEPGLNFAAFGPLAAGLGIIAGVWFMFYVFRPGKKTRYSTVRE